MVKQIELKIK